MQGGNWFAYCGNDPANRVDESGKLWESEAFQYVMTNIGKWLGKQCADAFCKIFGEIAAKEIHAFAYTLFERALGLINGGMYNISSAERMNRDREDEKRGMRWVSRTTMLLGLLGPAPIMALLFLPVFFLTNSIGWWLSASALGLLAYAIRSFRALPPHMKELLVGGDMERSRRLRE